MNSKNRKGLDPSEEIITGNWNFVNGKMVADDSCLRIEYLLKYSLKKLKQSDSGWDTLYFDSNTNSFWELCYPKSEMQGGGPPQLTLIRNNIFLTEKYKIDL